MTCVLGLVIIVRGGIAWACILVLVHVYYSMMMLMVQQLLEDDNLDEHPQ